MSEARDLRQAVAFEDLWNRLLTGESAPREPELDPGFEAFARRVHALSEPPPIDPVFKRQLWEDLMNASSSMSLRPPVAVPLSGTPRRAAPPSRTLPHRGHRGRLSAGMSFATMAALIALIGAMLFFIYQDQRQAALIPSVQSTPVPASSPCAMDAHDWPTLGGNAARTRCTTSAAPVSGHILWSTAVSPNGSNYTGVLAGGVLYWPTSGGLAAMDAATGRELWHSNEVSGSPTVDGDGLIASSATWTGAGYDLMRIERSDGSVVWRAEQGKLPDQATAAIVDRVGYVQSGQEFVAFDPATGKSLWRTPNATLGLGFVAVGDGRIYLGGQTNTLTAVSADGGDPLWTYTIAEASVGLPTFANGTVYFRSMDSSGLALYAVDAATGAMKWRIPSPISGSRFSNPAVSETTVYAADGNGNLDALDAETGALRWSAPIVAGDPVSPVLAGDTVIAGALGQSVLTAIDAATGAERWRVTLDSAVDSSTIAGNGAVYVHSASGTLYAIGGSDADAATPPAISSPPAVTAATSAVTSVAEYQWTLPGKGDSVKLNGWPALDPSGKLWVQDSASQQLRIYDLDGNYLESWGVNGTGDGQFDFTAPVGVFFAPDGGFYTLEPAHGRVQQFDQNRQFVRAWGSQGSGDGQFEDPGCIAIAPDGSLYIADHLRTDIQHFAADGTFLGKFGSPGIGEGQFNDGPPAVAVASDGTVYVPDHGNNRIQVFDAQGNYLREFGIAGSGDGQLNHPFWIALDDAGNLYVADSRNGRVQVFTPDGSFLGGWGELGSGPGKFGEVDQVLVNHHSSAFVLDGINSVVQKFRLLPPLGPD